MPRLRRIIVKRLFRKAYQKSKKGFLEKPTKKVKKAF
jgi:hypothetical protein